MPEWVWSRPVWALVASYVRLQVWLRVWMCGLGGIRSSGCRGWLWLALAVAMAVAWLWLGCG